MSGDRLDRMLIILKNAFPDELEEENKKLENALDKACNELSNLCFQTKCKDCHFVKEQEDENNDCPVQGNCCSYDWKEWCLKNVE